MKLGKSTSNHKIHARACKCPKVKQACKKDSKRTSKAIILEEGGGDDVSK